MANLKAILFDNDGTLVDTRELILANFREATRVVLGQEFSDEKYLAKVGTPITDQVKDFSDDTQVQDELVRVFRASNVKLHDQMISAFPGTLDALKQLSDEGFKMGLVTSKLRSVAWGGLRLLKIAPYMDCAAGAEDTEKHKPEPDPILYGCKLLDIDPSECVYVGDAPFDIQAGSAAGCFTAAVTWGMFSEEQLKTYNPSTICHDWTDLVAYAKKLK